MIRAEHVGQSRWRPSRGQVRTSFILQRRIGAQDVGMARELRLEFHGTFYHIINRGNYRHHVFGPAGVQIAFETCLSRPARSRVGCCTRLWSWATTTTSQWKRGRPILRSPVPFFIQNQPTLPVGRQLRPTDSSRISQSRFLGGVSSPSRGFSQRVQRAVPTTRPRARHTAACHQRHHSAAL